MSDHNKALEENNAKLLKENTALHAQLEFLKKDFDGFQEKTKEKLKSVIRLYDKSNSKVLKYLVDNKIMPRCSELINDCRDENCVQHNVEGLWPIKLG